MKLLAKIDNDCSRWTIFTKSTIFGLAPPPPFTPLDGCNYLVKYFVVQKYKNIAQEKTLFANHLNTRKHEVNKSKATDF